MRPRSINHNHPLPEVRGIRGLINFLAEAGQLKRVKRSGWWVVGIKEPESVAEHSFRCAIIGYILARMEKADPQKVVMMTLFNDMHEARLNDLHKVGHRYIDFKAAEDKAYKEQIAQLPMSMKNELTFLRDEYGRQVSQEAVIARDADILECVLQSKEYLEFGYKQAKSFMTVGAKFLKTKSAKAIFKSLKSWDPQEWWFHLKKFER